MTKGLLNFEMRRSSKLLFTTDYHLLIIRTIAIIALSTMLIPLVVLFYTSFTEGALTVTKFGLGNFYNIFNHPEFYAILTNTLTLALGSVSVMLLFAIPFAWLYTRTDLPAKSLLITFLTSNIAIPGFTVAMGYVLLLNPSNGIINNWLRQFGFGDFRFNIYGLGWMIFLQGIALVPPAFFMIVPTLLAIDSNMEEAAASNGVGRLKTTLKITLPLVSPAILAASIYYFIIAVETFDYASVLGFPVHIQVVSTWLYQLLNPGNELPKYGDAAALGILTTTIALLLGFAFIGATRRASRYVVISGKRREQQLSKLPTIWKFVSWAFIIVYLSLALILPLLMVIWASLLPYIQAPSVKAMASITLDAYHEAFLQLPHLAINNLIAMILVPTIAVTSAGCISWIIARSKSALRGVLDIFVMTAVAVPSIVSALAFVYFGLSTYSIIPLYGTIGLIVLAMSVRLITWANRSLSSAINQIHPEAEEACSTSGVPQGKAFFYVTLPLIKPAVVFSWFWISLLTLRELTIPVMLARPQSQTISTAIWGFTIAGNPDIACALSVILIAFIGVLLLTFRNLTKNIAL